MDITQLREIIGQQVRRYRRAKGHSQYSLALLCGMNRSYIGSLERGEHNVSLANLARIAAGLEVPLTEFLGEAAGQAALQCEEKTRNRRRTQRRQPPSGHTDTPPVLLNRKTFMTVLHQCAGDRPDLVTVYLERCGIRFLD